MVLSQTNAAATSSTKNKKLILHHRKVRRIFLQVVEVMGVRVTWREPMDPASSECRRTNHREIQKSLALFPLA